MRWIEAIALDTWANTQIGRAEIVRLVGKLIWATAPELNSFRFPAGDAGQIPGFDGHLVTPEGLVNPFVPSGESVWEFGAGQNYFKKAEDEYAGRTANPGAVVPSRCTFVFVTPRIWDRDDPTLIDWEKQKQAERKWRDVRAIDAVKLEHWLEGHEAVAKDFAREVKGLAYVGGARSIREFWEDYSERFNEKLIEAVILAGRRSDADDLIKQLVSGVPQAIKLQADSRDEVVAFAAAAIRTADAGVREFLEARALVLDTKQAVLHRVTAEGMVFLPRDEAIDSAGSLSHRAPTLIPLARVDPSARSLSRPTTYELSEALKQMVSGDERAERYAKECGRSVTILARRMPRGERPRPPWAGSEGLIAAVIAGAWDDAFEGDKAALEALSGRNYAAFEREMRALLSEPEPLEHEGSVWKVRAPVDTFVELGAQITSHDVERLRSVATTVFSEIDPALDLPIAERRFAELHGKKMRHSDWLRDGLATTLLQIAVLHDEARFQVTGISAQSFVNELVRSLPGLEQDARLIISLSRQLPWLIEAAPSPLLEALEHLLEGDGARILPIFEEGDSFFPASHHTHVLWALEVLAWDPLLLNTTALVLAKLTRIDPGGRLANRPIGSLTSLFRPWLPQTKATLAQRLEAIDLVVAHEPEVGWKLILELLPARQDSGMHNPKPRLREPSPTGEEILTRGIVYQTYGEVVNRAINLARGSWDRVVALLRTMDAFTQDQMERVCDELEKEIPVVPDGQRIALWTEVRDTVSRHAAYQEAQWAFPAAIVARLRSLEQRLAPVDPILKAQWLFDKHYPELDHAPGVERGAAVVEARSAAVQRLQAELGQSGLADLARRAKFPGLVGASAAGLLRSLAEFDQMVTVAYSSHDMPELFPMALSSVAHAKFGTEWESRIVDRAREGLAPAHLATLVLGWTDERAAWDLAERLGPEVVQSYWSRRTPYLIGGNLGDQERAAREYLKAGCAIAALRALGHATKELPAGLVFEMLDQAITEINRIGAPVLGDLAFEIGRTFDNLAARGDISQTDLARREYQYLPILKHQGNTLTLHRLMATEGAFFESVLCDVFRSASAAEEDATSERKARAHYGYELLSSMTLVPGFTDRAADEAKLFAWVSDVRGLAAEHDRMKVADQFIGQVLAHCPPDPDDGAWPHRLVRKLVEEMKSDEVERGIEVGRSNMVGAHPIDPKSPGALQHHLAAQARAWAQAALKWHRTAAMLNSMAEHWEWLASAMEQRGRQDAMRD